MSSYVRGGDLFPHILRERLTDAEEEEEEESRRVVLWFVSCEENSDIRHDRCLRRRVRSEAPRVAPGSSGAH